MLAKSNGWERGPCPIGMEMEKFGGAERKKR